MYDGVGGSSQLQTVSTQAVMELMKNVTVPEAPNSVRLSNDEVERFNIERSVGIDSNVAQGKLILFDVVNEVLILFKGSLCCT